MIGNFLTWSKNDQSCFTIFTAPRQDSYWNKEKDNDPQTNREQAASKGKAHLKKYGCKTHC